ncbi:hypothetical protein ACIBHX_11595 [Nonomuraea sp. NPDC050536]|uniref:hypothetical protein n=1 Tax=Nonomuraea sp. NPDC050536 TaxID=3364366 RepID=UPI0037CBACC4
MTRRQLRRALLPVGAVSAVVALPLPWWAVVVQPLCVILAVLPRRSPRPPGAWAWPG